jgi:hypothetical protein
MSVQSMKMFSKMKKIFKKLTLRKRANERGQQIICGRLPSDWSMGDNRNLIRLNRICEGLKPFHWDGKPRLINGVFECQVSLFKFGNVTVKPTFPDSVRDLVAYNRLMLRS